MLRVQERKQSKNQMGMISAFGNCFRFYLLGSFFFFFFFWEYKDKTLACEIIVVVCVGICYESRRWEVHIRTSDIAVNS